MLSYSSMWLKRHCPLLLQKILKIGQSYLLIKFRGYMEPKCKVYLLFYSASYLYKKIVNTSPRDSAMKFNENTKIA